MANRHLSRSIVLQSLFEWDFVTHGGGKADLKEIIVRNGKEFAPGMSDLSFVENLAQGVLDKRSTLDDIIEKAAPDWPIERISIVDRNILRIGLFELLFADRGEVPPKVAINEAIELAKTFGGENSGKFVNGVLGAVYKEIGEPNKDEPSARKKKTLAPEERAKLPLEKLGGAVVYCKKDGETLFALVHDIFGHWTLSKGHISEDEDEAAGTARELKEELSIDVAVQDKIGENEYVASHPEKGKIRKHVSYFIAESAYGPLKLEQGGGLDDARWWKLADLEDLNIYDDIIPIIRKGIEAIAKRV